MFEGFEENLNPLIPVEINLGTGILGQSQFSFRLVLDLIHK